MQRRPRRLFDRSTWTEVRFVREALREETTGGLLMLLAAAVALVWANLWQGSYERVSEFTIGPSVLHLDLSIATWAADGLLAIFFLVAGLELKREIVVGDLRNPPDAMLPIVAAVCGMVVPAAVYVLVNVIGDGDLAGWAVPTATDIAFALAVLAVIGSRLPTSVRAFLLTLAVVDDLLAIVIIAIFFTDDLSVLPLLGALALLVLYAFLQRRRVRAWWLYVPLVVLGWVLTHDSGVHATVIGVAFGLLTRVRQGQGEHESPAERLEHTLRPYSAAFCVPVFALFAAGVTLSSDSMRSLLTEPVALGVVLGLFVGKGVGIAGGTYLAARFSRAELNINLSWADVVGVAVLSGIGFTVSLLIGELAFANDAETAELVKAAVLVGSLLSAIVASVLLRRRNTVYRRMSEEEARDANADGIPDVFQQEFSEPDG